MFIPGNVDIVRLLQTDSIARHPFTWGPFLIGLGIAFFAPNDVLTNNAVLRALTEAMSWLVPSIQGWSTKSSYQQATALFFSVLWICMPLQVIPMYFNERTRVQFVSHLSGAAWRRVAFPIVIVPLVAVAVWILAVASFEDGENCTRFCINQSRTSLAFVGWLIPYTVAAGVAVVLIWLRHLPRLYLKYPRETKHESSTSTGEIQ